MELYGQRNRGVHGRGRTAVTLCYPIELELALPLLALGYFHPCRGLFESALKLRGLGGLTRPPHVLLLPCKR